MFNAFVVNYHQLELYRKLQKTWLYVRKINNKGNSNEIIRWSVRYTAHLINKGNSNEIMRWSVRYTAHLIIKAILTKL